MDRPTGPRACAGNFDVAAMTPAPDHGRRARAQAAGSTNLNAKNRTVTPATARATVRGTWPGAAGFIGLRPARGGRLTVTAPTAQGRAAGAMPVAGDAAPRPVRGRGIAARGNELAVNFGTRGF